MKYRVFWEPHAESQLERILSERTNQTRIVAAARAIDRHLINAPLEFGESRYDTVRIGFERPLGVLYEVLDDVRTVIVYEVWLIE
jgi:hypothetical protein